MNVVCTIVAKNYFASAKVLGESLKKTNPNVGFIILLADEIEKDDKFDFSNYSVIEAKDLGIVGFYEMAYKYDITEFCTSVKPFFIAYLFEKYNYDKIIYLDPDIYVFDSLIDIFNKLDFFSVVLTPHIIFNSGIETITQPDISVERGLLGSGVFNLGFVAFNSSFDSKQILLWWKDRLINNCYNDRNTYLYTDQKWMDLLPCLFDKICILRDPRFNIAWWNFHEREICFDGINWKTNKQGEMCNIVFVHFSGYKPNCPESITKADKSIIANKMDVILILFDFYKQCLFSNNYITYMPYSYKYNSYSNGYIITPLQRRLFRTLLEQDFKCENPFLVDSVYYLKLLESNLIIKNDVTKYNDTRINNEYKSKMIGFSKFIFIPLRFILGLKNYMNMIGFFENHVTKENQDFLFRHR